MTELSTHTRMELAHRSSDGMDVTLVWVQDDGEDRVVVCVCDRREGANFRIPAEPHLALAVYRTSASSTTGTVASRRSPR